jgi:hypothetical protein
MRRTGGLLSSIEQSTGVRKGLLESQTFIEDDFFYFSPPDRTGPDQNRPSDTPCRC